MPITWIPIDHPTRGWHSRAKLMNSESAMTLGLGLTIFMVLFWPGPKINGPVAVFLTIAPPDSCPSPGNESRTYLGKPTTPWED